MKNYKRVVKERYDRQRYDGKGMLKDIYSPINPVGFYGEFKAAQVLSDFVNRISKDRGTLDGINICDCGCGDGVKTRFLAELLGNPRQVYGVEYSENRLRHCRSMNPSIQYEYADLTEPGKGIPFETQFDGISAFVVFMHFSTEQEIMNALDNIYHSLKREGFFLWYELHEKSHWDGKKKNVDHWGFSPDEMDQYAKNAGFRLLHQYSVYIKVPILDVASVYLAKNIKNIWMLDILEMLPLKKSNLVRIYRKG
nr:class I SAM-dependent methyltransferase [uncultured Schaedlerella sp.]